MYGAYGCCVIERGGVRVGRGTEGAARLASGDGCVYAAEDRDGVGS